MRGGSLPLLATLAATALAGCGAARQDAHEPNGTYTVDVVGAHFPLHQRVSGPSRLVITVRNSGTATVPDLAVTVHGFEHINNSAGLADRNRPIFIVDRAPTGGVTAYTDTWAVGPLAPGAQRTLVWKVTAIFPGRHLVSYRVSAGLAGRARAQLSDGRPPAGSFRVAVNQAPAQTHVDPATGQVVAGPLPLGPATP